MSDGPIVNVTASLFAEAIRDLPLPNLYAKVSEIQNSVAHLHRSNDEMKSFIAESCETEEDRRELESYITENERLFITMTERIKMLKDEVERRGQRWVELSNGTSANNTGARTDERTESSYSASAATGTQAVPNGTTGESETQGSNGRDTEDGQGGIYL